MTKAYLKKVPPDMKGSSPSMAALEAERKNPKADCAYYSGAIGYQAAAKGLHDSYKPKGWEKIPAGLKDPNGTWWTVHTGYVACRAPSPASSSRCGAGRPHPATADWPPVLAG